MSGKTRTYGDALTVKRSALCKNDRLEPANNTSRARISAAAEQRRVNREENLMFAVSRCQTLLRRVGSDVSRR